MRLLVWALLFVAGCARGPSAQRCHLGEERELRRSSSMRLRSIALAVAGSSLLAAWSDEDGIRTVLLDGRGRVVSGPHVVADRGNAESMEAIADGDGYRLATLVPGDLFAGGGGAHLYRLDAAGKVVGGQLVGPAGAYSKRIALSRRAVVWHDGGPGTFVVRASNGTKAVELARGAMGALSPAVTDMADGGVGIAWVELQAAPRGPIEHGRRDTPEVDVPVKFRRYGADLVPRGPALTATHASIEGADPFVMTRRGDVLLAFRDVRPGDRRAGYYVSQIGRRGDARIGRANGPLGPDIVYCHGLYAGAAVRTHRHELLLGFNRFDLRGVKRGGELQIYSDRVHFGSVEVECLPDGYALLYGEEDERGARLLYNEVRCED